MNNTWGTDAAFAHLRAALFAMAGTNPKKITAVCNLIDSLELLDTSQQKCNVLLSTLMGGFEENQWPWSEDYDIDTAQMLNFACTYDSAI